MLHEKADGIATFTTTETFIDLFGRGDGEGGGFFIVEWTKPQVIDTPFFEFYETAYNLHYVDPAEYLLYGLLTYHVDSELITFLPL